MEDFFLQVAGKRITSPSLKHPLEGSGKAEMSKNSENDAGMGPDGEKGWCRKWEIAVSELAMSKKFEKGGQIKC